MATDQILRDLKTEESRLQYELKRVQEVITRLEEEAPAAPDLPRGPGRPRTLTVVVGGANKSKRRLSAAGRAAIAAAAKKRWAAYRKAQKKGGK